MKIYETQREMGKCRSKLSNEKFQLKLERGNLLTSFDDGNGKFDENFKFLWEIL